MKSHYDLKINGLDVRACFHEATIQSVCLPLLRILTGLYNRKGRRIVAFLAGPPGTGKSTLAAFLEQLSCQYAEFEPIQAVGIDGFHYHAEYIVQHTVTRDGVDVPMKAVKGCPESYNIKKLTKAIKDLRTNDIKWPFYDRRLHDAVENAVEIRGNIILIEGNWLLLNEGKWAGLKDLCDYSVMLRADESVLRERCIQRKVMGGRSPREAEEFYENSDRHNIMRCLSGSSPADLSLFQDALDNITKDLNHA